MNHHVLLMEAEPLNSPSLSKNTRTFFVVLPGKQAARDRGVFIPRPRVHLHHQLDLMQGKCRVVDVGVELLLPARPALGAAML
jgi:hypothetical protein